MIPITAYRGQNVIVLGLGRTGISSARALKAGGANVYAWDDNKACLKNAEAHSISIADPNRIDWQKFDALILSPGVAFRHPKPNRIVQMAQMVGVPIMSDIELFARALNELPEEERPVIVGITGTNGKSTTTALIGHILRHAGHDVQTGGNIGTGVLDMDDFRPGAVYVLELSSYQLELASSLRCNIGILLNISPDHLDRHGGMEGYKKVKRRIFANQTGDDVAIIGCDDIHTQITYTHLRSEYGRHIVPVSSTMALPGAVSVGGGVLRDDIIRSDTASLSLDGAKSLRGKHNHQNAAAAYAVCRALKIDRQRIIDGMKSFTGLPHRMEVVAEIEGVFFVNDSKATNAESALNALRAYPEAYWIAGGRPKEDNSALSSQELKRVKRAYLIGEAMDLFDKLLGDNIAVKRSGALDTAVAQAFADARKDQDEHPVILLSPACASFDQFSSFEARGDAFREAVRRLSRRSAA